jgi:amino-acid N-acetyltransferase
MSDHELTLKPATDETIDRVERILEANGLPSDDIQTKQGCFVIAFDGQTWIGVGGIESYGSHGLLRSVVVQKGHRDQGYGTDLCTALEEYARRQGVDTLHLLTTTAVEFFRKNGYAIFPRDEAPPRLQQTTEFTEYCPASATYLRKHM